MGASCLGSLLGRRLRRRLASCAGGRRWLRVWSGRSLCRRCGCRHNLIVSRYRCSLVPGSCNSRPHCRGSRRSQIGDQGLCEGEDAGDVQDEGGLEVEDGHEPGKVVLSQSCQLLQAGWSMVCSPDVLSGLAQWGLCWHPLSVMKPAQRLQEAAGCINKCSCSDGFGLQA